MCRFTVSYWLFAYPIKVDGGVQILYVVNGCREMGPLFLVPFFSFLYNEIKLNSLRREASPERETLYGIFSHINMGKFEQLRYNYMNVIIDFLR